MQAQWCHSFSQTTQSVLQSLSLSLFPFFISYLLLLGSFRSLLLLNTALEWPVFSIPWNPFRSKEKPARSHFFAPLCLSFPPKRNYSWCSQEDTLLPHSPAVLKGFTLRFTLTHRRNYAVVGSNTLSPLGSIMQGRSEDSL